MSHKPIVFLDNFQVTLANAITSAQTVFQLPAPAIAELDAVMQTDVFRCFLTLHNSAKTKIVVVEAESLNTTTNFVNLPSGHTVGENFSVGDFCSMFIPADVLHKFRQRQYRNAGTLASGVGFTAYAENEVAAGINNGSHPITIDLENGAFDGSASCRLILAEQSSSTLGTFSWLTGGMTIRWETGTAPSFTSAGQTLVVDFVVDAYNAVINGSWKRYG